MRAVAVLFAVFWGFLFFGLIDLLVFLQGAEFMPSFHLETGWGLFFLIIVAAPLLAIALRPGAVLPAALQQVFAAGVTVAIGAALSGSPAHFIPAAGVAATALTVAAVGRVRTPLPNLRRWSWTPGALVVAAAGPCVAYARMSAKAAHRRLIIRLTRSVKSAADGKSGQAPERWPCGGGDVPAMDGVQGRPARRDGCAGRVRGLTVAFESAQVADDGFVPT
jgi:hypothetical protein